MNKGQCHELYNNQDGQTRICTLEAGHNGEHSEEPIRIEDARDKGNVYGTVPDMLPSAPAPEPPHGSPAEISHQFERQGFLQHEQTVNKLALFFRKHYQREMRDGRHAGMTMDQCVIHYLQLERAVPGWIKEWCLRLRGGE